jgi:hypothetical protein
MLMDTIKKEGKKTLVFGKKGHIIKNLLWKYKSVKVTEMTPTINTNDEINIYLKD